MLTRNYPEEIQFHNQIYFHIPAIYDRHILPFFQSIYPVLLTYKRKNIYKLIAYGCPSFCIWNGGRFIGFEMYRIEIIKNIITNYISFGIDLQFTFTNTLLQETDVYDRYGNAILDIAYEYKEHCEIMVASDILETYIRNKYPELRIAKSILKNTKPSIIDTEKYSTIVVPIWLNHDQEYLKYLVNNSKADIELLIDEDCVPDCPCKKEHYDLHHEVQLYIEHQEDMACAMIEYKRIPEEHNILPDELNEYIDIGIHHFKLSDRDMISKMVESCVYYMIPYDVQRVIRQELYSKCKYFL